MPPKKLDQKSNDWEVGSIFVSLFFLTNQNNQDSRYGKMFLFQNENFI